VNELQGVRIARVSTVPYFMVTQLKGQIEYLSEMGAKVVVITSPGPELKMVAGKNVSVKTIDIPRSIQPFRDLVALLRLLRCFRSNRFAIVHSTTPKAGLLCAVAGAFLRVPVRLHTFTGQPWVSLTGPVRHLARWADWLIGRLTTRCYADSESQRDFLVAERVVSASKIGVIGKGSVAGVDLQRFDPTRWSEGEKAAMRRELSLSVSGHVILFVGRVTGDKGIRELLKAFDALLHEGYDLDLLLVGPLDTELGGAAGLDAKTLVKQRRVRHVGYTDCPERYMAIADFLCLPSYREGFGTVVIEAAAMGLPTVGTQIYGLSDAVEDGVTGTLVPPRNVGALAEAIREMLNNQTRLARMGQAARARCLADFDSTKVNALVAKEYARLLTGLAR